MGTCTCKYVAVLITVRSAPLWNARGSREDWGTSGASTEQEPELPWSDRNAMIAPRLSNSHGHSISNGNGNGNDQAACTESSRAKVRC